MVLPIFQPAELPEFYDDGGEVVYQLDKVSRDDDELQRRGEKLVNRGSMDVSEFKIRSREGNYGLYVR